MIKKRGYFKVIDELFTKTNLIPDIITIITEYTPIQFRKPHIWVFDRVEDIFTHSKCKKCLQECNHNIKNERECPYQKNKHKYQLNDIIITKLYLIYYKIVIDRKSNLYRIDRFELTEILLNQSCPFVEYTFEMIHVNIVNNFIEDTHAFYYSNNDVYDKKYQYIIAKCKDEIHKYIGLTVTSMFIGYLKFNQKFVFLIGLDKEIEKQTFNGLKINYNSNSILHYLFNWEISRITKGQKCMLVFQNIPPNCTGANLCFGPNKERCLQFYTTSKLSFLMLEES